METTVKKLFLRGFIVLSIAFLLFASAQSAQASWICPDDPVPSPYPMQVDCQATCPSICVDNAGPPPPPPAGQDFTIAQLFLRASQILSMTLGLLIGIAFVVFIWGVIQYVVAQGDEKKLAEGRKYMLWGIIGLVVIISIWGIVNLIVFTIFGETAISNPFDFAIPQIP